MRLNHDQTCAKVSMKYRWMEAVEMADIDFKERYENIRDVTEACSRAMLIFMRSN